MEEIIVLGICILVILILKFAFGIKIKDIKKIKSIGYDKELNSITNRLPENKIVCEEILKQLNNTDVIIKTNDDKDNALSYYSVMSNQIIIANIKDTFTRIQTIAHECVHSMQNRTTLLFNFIYSNIYLLYFIGIIILTITKVIENTLIPLIGLILAGCVYYAIRSYLETDAMTKAPYVTKEYIEKSGKMSNEDMNIVMDNYKKMNAIGIPMTNFNLLVSVIIKVIIYCIITIIV